MKYAIAKLPYNQNIMEVLAYEAKHNILHPNLTLFNFSQFQL